eukprot:GHVT01067728.1.p1 GENE.GHVT01067728.1~~GHVT01067728.1.p1  ORF type:complete len:247 (-),score=23.79 GHVT01067728.1:76-816(-)
MKARAFVIREYVKAKADPKASTKWLSMGASVCCIILIPSLVVDLVTMALTLGPMELLADVYAILGALIVLATEDACRANRFGFRPVIHYYFAFLEFRAGRGLVQIIVASYCISVRNLLFLWKFIPGVVLLAVGFVNVLWGMYAACKLNSMMARLRAAEDHFGDGEDPGRLSTKLDLLDRKFEALNKRGDGLLTKADLEEGIAELNLNMDALELDIVFSAMDKDGDGFIDKQEFEAWWVRDKGLKFL